MDSKHESGCGAEAVAMRFFTEFGEKLYNTAYLMCRNAADAEDLTMRTIELAFRHFAQYDPSKPVFPWLCGILTNCYRMDLRGKARNALDFVANLPETECDYTPPAEILAREADARAVREAVRRLPDGYRMLVVLRYYDDLTVPQIAGMTGIPEGSVKRKLHEAKKIMRRELMKTKNAPSALMALFALMAATAFAAPGAVAEYDSNMAVAGVAAADGLEWIDGRVLPLEGRAFDDVEHYYDRLPAGVSTNVNQGVRDMKHHTSGMQFRFTTDSDRLAFKWTPYNGGWMCMDHMPKSGMSGIDVYRFDEAAGCWRYVRTGRIDKPSGARLDIPWTPGTPCLVNLPLYNGVREFSLGIAPGAAVHPPGPRKSGIDKPVVFYGTSITQGGCASRPGMGFVNIIGRELDVPVVNLGFSGSGVMEFEMSSHLARIDASCYVLDCLHNMRLATDSTSRPGRNMDENYEPFIRNLRSKRPDVPIVMAEQCDVHCGGPCAKDRLLAALYEKLKAEGWRNLVYLPKDQMYPGDAEGTVDGTHPNDYGMMSLARAYGAAVAKALGLEKTKDAANDSCSRRIITGEGQ